MISRTGLTGEAIESDRQVPRARKLRSTHTRLAAAAGVIGIMAVLALALIPVQSSTATPTREGSCACHPTGGDELLTVTGLPASYEPGITYTIVITVADSNGATGENSFSMDIVGGGMMNASMQTDPNVEINIENQRASANDSVSPMDVSSWQVNWTAPSSGPVTFTVNAVTASDTANGQDALTDSDEIAVDVTAIPEFPTLIIPLFAILAAVLIAVKATKRT